MSFSDIIPDALTNGKICNRYVCRINHNNKFSDAFESEVIEGLSVVTNALNIKSSKGKNFAKHCAAGRALKWVYVLMAKEDAE